MYMSAEPRLNLVKTQVSSKYFCRYAQLPHIQPLYCAPFHNFPFIQAGFRGEAKHDIMIKLRKKRLSDQTLNLENTHPFGSDVSKSWHLLMNKELPG